MIKQICDFCNKEIAKGEKYYRVSICKLCVGSISSEPVRPSPDICESCFNEFKTNMSFAENER